MKNKYVNYIIYCIIGASLDNKTYTLLSMFKIVVTNRLLSFCTYFSVTHHCSASCFCVGFAFSHIYNI